MKIAHRLAAIYKRLQHQDCELTYRDFLSIALSEISNYYTEVLIFIENNNAGSIKKGWYSFKNLVTKYSFL